MASQLAAWRARRGVALDITALPDLDILSAKVLLQQPVPHVLQNTLWITRAGQE